MIGIKDMEMPSSCISCDIKSGSFCYVKNKPPYNIKGNLFTRDDDCPLVEIEERKGKWIKEEKATLGWDGHSYQCSVCGRSIHLDTEVEDLEDYPYCHCGAEMEIGEDGKWIND